MSTETHIQAKNDTVKDASNAAHSDSTFHSTLNDTWGAAAKTGSVDHGKSGSTEHSKLGKEGGASGSGVRLGPDVILPPDYPKPHPPIEVPPWNQPIEKPFIVEQKPFRSNPSPSEIDDSKNTLDDNLKQKQFQSLIDAGLSKDLVQAIQDKDPAALMKAMKDLQNDPEKMKQFVDAMDKASKDFDAESRIQRAILDADPKALADEFGKYKDDPEALKRHVAAVESNLKAAGLHISTDGKNVYVYGKFGEGLAFNADGTVEARTGIGHGLLGKDGPFNPGEKDGSTTSVDAAVGLRNQAVRNLQPRIISDPPHIEFPDPRPYPVPRPFPDPGRIPEDWPRRIDPRLLQQQLDNRTMQKD